jgi:hypothetical protein
MATSSDELNLLENRLTGIEASPQRKKGRIMNTKRKFPVRESTGNLFADLGFPNAEREQLKAQLTLRIYRLNQAAWPHPGAGG